jgi:flagellin-like protein
MNKKAISPVIATVLLISLVVVLASIIFLWARAFIPETIQKFGSPIADSCASVVFEASYSNGVVTIQNNGNVPIYSIQVGIKKGFSVEYSEVTPATIVTGGTGDYDVSGASIETDDELIIVPVLLGKTSNGELKGYACSDENAKIIRA